MRKRMVKVFEDRFYERSSLSSSGVQFLDVTGTGDFLGVRVQSHGTDASHELHRDQVRDLIVALQQWLASKEGMG
jgi:hypothetical protein